MLSSSRSLLVLAVLLPASAALAGTLRGKLVRPPPPHRALDGAERPPRPGYWRLDNGRLPVEAPTPPLTPAVVILVPRNPVTPSPQRRTVEVRSLTLEPRLVAAPVGTLFELHNGTRSPRTLYLEGGESLLAPMPMQPGERRQLQLPSPGEYRLRDAGYPQAIATLVVVETALCTLTNDKDEFDIEAPSGSYLLKAYIDGSWSVTQRVTVGRAGGAVTVRVPGQGEAAEAADEAQPKDARSGTAAHRTQGR